MMSILYSWKEGLTLLLPRNLKPFVLVTLKSIAECYKVYFKYFWWIPVIALLHAYAYEYWRPYIYIYWQDIKYTNIDDWIRALFNYTSRAIFGFNTIVVWLAVRPSSNPKNYIYFKSMLFKYCLPFAALILIKMTPIIVPFYYDVGDWFVDPVTNPFALVFDLWNLLTIFFVTDTQNSFKNFFKNWWRAFLMLIYNLPILAIILVLLFFASIPAFFVLKEIVFFWCIRVFIMMLSPIMICIFANIYIRCLTDHYDLYFQQKENESSQGNI